MSLTLIRFLEVNGEPHPVRFIFGSRWLTSPPLVWFGIGGLTLGSSTVRLKRRREEVPKELLAHEIGHILQAKRLGWRYLPTYLFRRRQMEWEAEMGSYQVLDRYDWLHEFGSMFKTAFKDQYKRSWYYL